MTTRDLSNKRVKVSIGLANSVANVLVPTLAELTAMLNASSAIRWDGYDFGMQESDREDDRSLADDAAATIRGFAQFGGSVPFFAPKITDTGSILRLAYNLYKATNTELVVAERVGFKDESQAWAAGDYANIYRIVTDGFNPDTEGSGGYVYQLAFTPKGDVNPWFIVPAASPATVTISGAGTQALSVGATALRQAAYQGRDITLSGTWVSSDATKAQVIDGIIIGIAAGTANITCTYPGGTTSTAVVVTVS